MVRPNSWSDSKWYIFGRIDGDLRGKEGEYIFIWRIGGEDMMESSRIYFYDDVKAMVEDDDLLLDVPGSDKGDLEYLRAILKRWLEEVDRRYEGGLVER